ncbi:hypothetical protein SI65_07357 [Aspergillus cristatus]|uniref:Transcription factor domain-containing protein n=1 Tax=Aspergillus cristatus TaxID=573508 RepID=A0A1E3B7P9_ASPCR|nr:hypothetical protein SI65_07357 [Aspergillus cristatus]
MRRGSYLHGLSRSQYQLRLWPGISQGRPRHVRKGAAEAGLSLEGSGRKKHDEASTPRRGQTLGGELEQMFDEDFIRSLGSRSDLFQNSIASFQRHAQQQQQSLSSDHEQKKDRRSMLGYDGLLSFLAYEMVEILCLRIGSLRCEHSGSGQAKFYITSLAADTIPAMFDRPQRANNSVSALGQHRMMQLVDIWFSMHPLSPLVSKTLLFSAIRDGTVDEALLAVILADACEVFGDSNIGAMSSSNDGKDPVTLVQYAADQLKDRALLLADAVTLSTAQAMILLGWRELSRGHARRATCYIRYTCRIVARQHQQLQKQDELHGMKLNGIGIADVEKEILQNIYWLCLSSTTWAFMQIDQPFSILGPDGLPGFPSMDENTSAVLRLDQASGNISTLHSQIQTMRWMWPLGHVTSTVAHVYTLYLNTPTKDCIVQPANSSTLSLEIRDILNQAIRLVEREVTTPNLQSFLLIAYHTIVIHMVFSPAQIASSSSSVDEFCKSTSTLLDIAQRFPSLLPTRLVSTQRTYIASTLALALDTCSAGARRLWQQGCMEDEHHRTARQTYYKAIRQAKRECWEAFLQGSQEPGHHPPGTPPTPDEAARCWLALKYTKPQDQGTTPTLYRAQGDTQAATTFQEKETLIREAAFPQAPKDRPVQCPPLGNAHTEATESAVQQALFSQATQKAPGVDQLNFQALRLLWKWDSQRIVTLARQCLRLGFHPPSWKVAKGILLRKPNKTNYSLVKAYRVISLVRCCLAENISKLSVLFWQLLADGLQLFILLKLPPFIHYLVNLCQCGNKDL